MRSAIPESKKKEISRDLDKALLSLSPYAKGSVSRKIDYEPIEITDIYSACIEFGRLIDSASILVMDSTLANLSQVISNDKKSREGINHPNEINVSQSHLEHLENCLKSLNRIKKWLMEEE